VVLQTSSSMIKDSSRPLQSVTSDELGRSKSQLRSRQNLAPVVAIGLDRPFSDVQVNISSSSSKDEDHLNLPVIESEVGIRPSEVKDL